MNEADEKILLYTSSFCGQSRAVEQYMQENRIPVTIVNIDQDNDAREKVKSLNRGYASVPTLIFPDGSQLTEPSFAELRAKLDQRGVNGGFLSKIRGSLGRFLD